MLKYHCMPNQVRLLASGLSAEADQLSIETLNCSTPAARYFVKNVLGVPSVPSFCIFPRQSRTFYKYRQVLILSFVPLLHRHSLFGCGPPTGLVRDPQMLAPAGVPAVMPNHCSSS